MKYFLLLILLSATSFNAIGDDLASNEGEGIDK
jgi:hypothetical protein